MTGTTDTERPLDLSELTDGQRRGADCIRCGLPVQAATAILLPNEVDDDGVRLFPRRHKECPSAPAAAAFWAHVEGRDVDPGCFNCASGSHCKEGVRLQRAAFDEARPSAETES